MFICILFSLGTAHASSFTLTNSNGGDGYVVDPSALVSGAKFDLYGADNDVGENYTTYYSTVNHTQTKTISWTYNTYDGDGVITIRAVTCSMEFIINLHLMI
jgi:hypothetical protein